MHCQHASRRCKPQAVVTEAQPESATCTPPQENRQLLSKQDRWSMAASRQFLLTAATTICLDLDSGGGLAVPQAIF